MTIHEPLSMGRRILVVPRPYSNRVTWKSTWLPKSAKVDNFPTVYGTNEVNSTKRNIDKRSVMLPLTGDMQDPFLTTLYNRKGDNPWTYKTKCFQKI